MYIGHTPLSLIPTDSDPRMVAYSWQSSLLGLPLAEGVLSPGLFSISKKQKRGVMTHWEPFLTVFSQLEHHHVLPC